MAAEFIGIEDKKMTDLNLLAERIGVLEVLLANSTNKRISQLAAIPPLENDDLVAIVDVTDNTTKKSTMTKIMNYVGSGSAGMLTGGAITEATSTTVDVSAGTGYLRQTDSHTGILEKISWSISLSISTPTDTVRYLGVDYNGGNPIVVIKSVDTWNRHTEFRLGSVVNESDTLHILDNPWQVANGVGHSIERFFETLPFKRADRIGGLIIGDPGSRQITVTAGEIYDLTNEFVIPAIDTSVVSTFETYLGLTVDATGQQVWDNLNYNDDGVKTALGANKWATLWWYLEANGKLVMNYGIMEHVNQAAADLEPEPPVRPVRVQVHGTLIGRTVFKQNAATGDFQSAFVTQFAGAGAADHLQLSNLTTGDAGHTQFLMLDGSKAMTGDLDFTAASNDYKFGIAGSVFEFWNQRSSAPSILNMYSKDGDGTDLVALRLYRLGSPDNPTPAQSLDITSSTTEHLFRIWASGTSNQPDMLLQAGTVNEQLRIIKDDGMASLQKWNNDKPFDRYYQRIRGSAIVQDGDGIVEFRAQGWDGVTFRDAASIKAVVAGTPGADDMPGKWEFYTTPNGSFTLKLGLTIEDEDVTCEGNGAIFAPAGTTGEAPSPTGGGHRFNSTTGRNEFGNGSTWVNYVISDAPTLLPFFIATVGGTSHNVTGDGTLYTIICGSEIADVGNHYNHVTGTFAAPTTGLYQFDLITLMQDFTASHTDIEVYLNVVGTSQNWLMFEVNAANVRRAVAPYYIALTGSTSVKLISGDAVTIKVRVSNGTKAVDVMLGTKFSGRLITKL